jgi:hypothetical protein
LQETGGRAAGLWIAASQIVPQIFDHEVVVVDGAEIDLVVERSVLQRDCPLGPKTAGDAFDLRFDRVGSGDLLQMSRTAESALSQ